MQKWKGKKGKDFSLRFLAWFVCGLFLAFGLFACGGGGGGGGGEGGGGPSGGETTYQEPDPMSPPVTKQQDVDVSLPRGSSLNNETLKILSFYGTSQVAPKAQRLYKTIPVIVTDTDKGQIVILADSNDNPLFFSYLKASEGTVTISSESIAKGLIWMNPYVMVLPADQKKQLMEQAVKSNLFPQLKDKIDNLLVTDPRNLLDPDKHPEIVKTAFTIVKEAFETLGAQQLPKIYKDIGASGNLRVLDKDGNDVGFENPKMITYGVEVIDSSNHKTNILVKGKEGLVQFGWPLVVKTPPEVETENFPDGRYIVKFYKGFNTDIPNWWLPYIPGFFSNGTIAGTATWYNTFDIVGILIDTLSGVSINKKVGIGRIVKDAGKIQGFTDFAIALKSGDPIKTLEATVKLLREKNNWKIFANAIWGTFGPDSRAFLHAAKVLIKNIATVLKAVDWTNHHIPFIYDLAFAPGKVEYCVEQINGILEECSTFVPLIPPTASLLVSPKKPYVGDNVTFDASGSTDDRTTYLKYRFDFDGDGSWDTNWSYSATATYSFPSKGIYNAKVEVMDEDGLTSLANYYVTVYERSQGVSTAIVIDRSGSMTWGSPPAIEAAKDAAKTYIGFMGSADRAALISFGTDVTVDQSFTDNLDSVRAAIDALQAFGDTSLYDAIYQAITEIKNEDSNRRKAIIVLTDGMDNKSRQKFQDVVDYAKKVGIPIYTIGLGSYIDESTLRDLAKQTNGIYFQAPDSSQLKNIYDTIAEIQ